MSDQEPERREPGVCIPWDEERRTLPEIQGDEEVVRKVWEEVDALGYLYVWHLLLSF